jgi:20S proteasome subunit beta 7
LTSHIAETVHEQPASYGSLARFRDIERLHPLSDSCVMGVAGDMSDFQALKKMLEALM